MNDAGNWKFVKKQHRLFSSPPTDDWDQAGVLDMSDSTVYEDIESVMEPAPSSTPTRRPTFLEAFGLQGKRKAAAKPEAPKPAVEHKKFRLCLTQEFYVDAREVWVHEGNTSTKAWEPQVFELAKGCVVVDTAL